LPHPSGCRRRRRPAGDGGQAPRRTCGRPRSSPRATHLLGEADHLADAPGCECSLVAVIENGGELDQALLGRIRGLETRSVPDSLEHWPIRDPLAVRKTTAPRNECAVGHVLAELANEARLSHPRRTDDGEELARAVAKRLFEGVAETTSFSFAPDHRRVEATTGVERDGTYSDETREVSPRLDIGGVTEDPPGALVHEDLIRRRSLLEPNRRLHRVTGSKRPIGFHDDENLAGSDTHAELERGSPVSKELVARRFEALAHLDRGTCGPQGVVLVDHRDPEDRGDCAAHRALDRRAVALEYGEELVEAARRHLVERLGIELRTGRKDLARQHGHRLSRLSWQCGPHRFVAYGDGDGLTRQAELGVMREDPTLELPQLGTRL
jgi:hypothetical protein